MTDAIPKPSRPRTRPFFKWAGAVMVIPVVLVVGLAMTAHHAGPPPEAMFQAEMKSLEISLHAYKLLGGNYPSTRQGLHALIEKPTDDPRPKRWSQVMKRVPLDPWGESYRYKFPGRENPEEPEIVSVGADGVEGTGDDFVYQVVGRNPL